MPTVCEESGASSSGFDSTLDLKNKLLSQEYTHEKCTCHEFTPSGRQFGRTLSLDPSVFSRCAGCQKKTGTKVVRYEKIPEDVDGGSVNVGGSRPGGTRVVENRMGGTQLVLDPDREVRENLLHNDDEQNENDLNDKKEERPGDFDLEKGPGPRARKPWTRRKLTLKITVALIVIALAIAGVVLGVMNRSSKTEVDGPPVNQKLHQKSTLLPVTELHTHSPRRNCTLVMELNKNNISEGSQDFQTYTLPWRPHSRESASNAILYSPETLSFNATRPGYFSVHIDVHIDTNFWINKKDLHKTFSSVLCIQFPRNPSSKKCITNKYQARTVSTQQLHKEVFLEGGESFHVTIEVNNLDMIYHLKTDKNNLIEIASKTC